MKFRIKLVFIITVILFWNWLTWMEIWPTYIFPSPFMVLKSLYKGFFEDGNTLVLALVLSLKRALIGFTLSISIGILIGIIMTYNIFFEENLKMIALGVQAIPSICWVPLAILWFGLNESAILFVMIIGSTFSISISIYSGIRHISPIHIVTAKNLGARGIKMFFNIIIPAILPALVVGMKQGWAFTWRALMAGEMLSSNVGLGQTLVMARDLADISRIFSIMIIIAAIGCFAEKYVFEKIDYSIKMKRGLLNDF